ncbi:MAG: response regulator [Burkholderiaceae bacterium]|nr:response regulator [Burkholderiaceae bacterium]
MRLLLVEDDADLVQALTRALAARGFELVSCGDGSEALLLARRRDFDAIVLDLSLPGLDGLHVLQRLRRSDDLTPVLVLTARGAVGERVAGLNAGADDYLAKPFDLDELEARVRALIRRYQGEGDWRCGFLRCERTGGALFLNERPLDLAPREAALLRALIAHAGRAVSKEKLHAVVFASEDQAPQPDAIEVVVHRLRKRLAGAAADIVTLRGVGYALSEDKAALVGVRS